MTARTARLFRGNEVIDETGTITVLVKPLRHAVALGIDNRTVCCSGSVSYRATATLDRPLGTSSYGLRIQKSDGTEGSCTGTTITACVRTIKSGHAYRAVVDDFAQNEYGSSPWFLVEDENITELDVGGIDLTQLAGLFSSIDALCLTLQGMPGVNTDPDSPDNPAKICLIEQANGKTMAQILAAVIARSGASGIAGYLIFVATPQDLDDGSPPWYPPPLPPGTDPPYNPNPPTTMPGVWDAPLAAAAERILAHNPPLHADEVNAKEIAKEIAKACVWLSAQALLPLSDCGVARLPIFVTGGNVMDVTKRTISARLAVTRRGRG